TAPTASAPRAAAAAPTAAAAAARTAAVAAPAAVGKRDHPASTELYTRTRACRGSSCLCCPRVLRRMRFVGANPRRDRPTDCANDAEHRSQGGSPREDPIAAGAVVLSLLPGGPASTRLQPARRLPVLRRLHGRIRRGVAMVGTTERRPVCAR